MKETKALMVLMDMKVIYILLFILPWGCISKWGLKFLHLDCIKLFGPVVLDYQGALVGIWKELSYCY